MIFTSTSGTSRRPAKNFTTFHTWKVHHSRSLRNVKRVRTRSKTLHRAALRLSYAPVDSDVSESIVHCSLNPKLPLTWFIQCMQVHTCGE